MHAIIETGGKQYRVKEGDIISVEKLEKSENDSFEIENIIAVGDSFGDAAKGAKVKAKVLSHLRAPKVIIFKKKRRKNYRRKNGHRQDLSSIQIESITA